MPAITRIPVGGNPYEGLFELFGQVEANVKLKKTLEGLMEQKTAIEKEIQRVQEYLSIFKELPEDRKRIRVGESAGDGAPPPSKRSRVEVGSTGTPPAKGVVECHQQ